MQPGAQTAATARRKVEVVDIGLLARRFMRFERSMRIYRMLLAYVVLAAVFLLPGALLISFAALRSETVIVGAAALAAMWLALLALCYGVAYGYGRCVAGSRRAVMVLAALVAVLDVVFALSLLAVLFIPGVVEGAKDKPTVDAATSIGGVVMMTLILGGLIAQLRTGTAPGAALMVDRNYTQGFHRARGLGRDLLRVMGI